LTCRPEPGKSKKSRANGTMMTGKKKERNNFQGEADARDLPV